MPIFISDADLLVGQSDTQTDQMRDQNRRDHTIIIVGDGYGRLLLFELNLAVSARRAYKIRPGLFGIQQFSLHLPQGKLAVLVPLRIPAARGNGIGIGSPILLMEIR